MIAQMLQKFVDPDTVQNQVFSNKPDPEDLLSFIYPSQLETTYGGTAPVVTKFWPPTVPPITEKIDEKALNLLPRSEYLAHIQKHPSLPRMPRSMMADLQESRQIIE
jgi:hypothetical protein